MSYSKITVYYYGDGIALNGKNTRQNVLKKKTINLTKKIQDYIDDHGTGSIQIRGNQDHLEIYGGSTLLFDQDINGDSREYISSIQNWEWIY